MGAIENYPIDIIKRTKEILEDSKLHAVLKKEDREVAFLLNCLLGLIVAISENEKRKSEVFKGNIDDDFLKLIPQKVGFIKKDNNKYDLTKEKQINLYIGHRGDLKQKTKQWFINKIRNSIAHQNIDGVSVKGEWTGVCLSNIYSSRKDFEIIFSVEELRNFALKLSTIYLEEKEAS